MRKIRRSLREGHGPPILAILVFVGFSVLVLSFVALRQMHTAEQRCLRLLSGFSHRIEVSVEDLVGRFVRQAAKTTLPGEGEPLPILENIQSLDLLSWTRARRATSPRLSVQMAPDTLFLRYEGPGEKASASEGSEGTDAQPDARRIEASIDLKALAGSFDQSIFSSILLAEDGGRVIFQQGEPELRVESVAAFLPVETSRPLTEPDAVTGMRKVEIAGMSYRLFFQPLSIEVAARDDFEPRSIELTAYGLVPSGNLLSTSFLSSPLLMLITLAIFPAGLIAWPLLKLWLMSPRQRFTRVDMAFLLSCCVLGLSLLTILVFTAHFYLKLRLEVSAHVERVAQETVDRLDHELACVGATLEFLEGQKAKARNFSSRLVGRPDYEAELRALHLGQRTLSPSAANGLENQRWNAQLEAYRAFLEALASAPAIADGAPSFSYPYLHALYFISRDGEMATLLPFSRYSANKGSVESREYFRCAQAGDGFDIAERALCVESILSNTSGRALAAVARRESSDDPNGKSVVAATTELLSIRHPLLPSNFHVAVVDPDGVVQFHSDPSRNLVENLLKATDGDSELRALLRNDRSGRLDTTYEGRDHLAAVQSLDGLPWSLVVLRQTSDVRQRTLEVLLDFANPFALQTAALLLIMIMGFGFLYLRRTHRPDLEMAYLWPDEKLLPAYHIVAMGTPLLLMLAAFTHHLGYGLRFWLSIACPFLVVITVGVMLYCVDASRQSPLLSDDRLAGLHTILAATFGTLLAVWLALTVWNGDAEGWWWTAPVLWVGLAVLYVFLCHRSVQHAKDCRSKTLVYEARHAKTHSAAKLAVGIATALLMIAFGVRHWSLFTTLALGVAAICVLCCWSYRQAFRGTQRRRAYLIALACLLLFVGFVPTAGLLTLAAERQIQLFVESTQVALGDALLANRTEIPPLQRARDKPFWRALDPEPSSWYESVAVGQAGGSTFDEAEVDEHGSPAADGASDQSADADAETQNADSAGPTRPKVHFLDDPTSAWQPIFGSVLANSEVDASAVQKRSRFWRRPGHEGSLIATWMSRRPFKLYDIASEPTGGDLSRFSATMADNDTAVADAETGRTSTWWPMAERRIRGAVFVGPKDTQFTIESDVPDLSLFPQGIPSQIFLILGLAAIPLAAVGLALVMAEKVLQTALVPPEAGGGVLRLQELVWMISRQWLPIPPGQGASENDSKGDSKGVAEVSVSEPNSVSSGRPLLLVTATPDLVIEYLERISDGEDEEWAGSLRPEEWEKNLRPRLIPLVGRGDFDVADPKDDVPPQHEIAIVTHFRPDLSDHETASRQIDQLTRIVKRDGPTVIVSRLDPRDLESRLPPAEATAGSTITAGERWIGFLSRFALVYLRTGEPASRFDDDLDRLFQSSYHQVPKKRLGGPSRDRVQPWRAASPAVRITLRRETCASGWLQELGLDFASRMLLDLGEKEDPDGRGRPTDASASLNKLTAPQLIARIMHMSRAYYSAIWSACRTDEQVVLFQLAQDGFVNPYNFEVLSDLVHKGLVVRDPVLRVMNESFARFIRQNVKRSSVVQWEEEEGTSAWSVFKWLLPLPLLLVGGFLFVTEGSAFSNLMGLLVAAGSVIPTFHNIFDYFQRISARDEGIVEHHA